MLKWTVALETKARKSRKKNQKKLKKNEMNEAKILEDSCLETAEHSEVDDESSSSFGSDSSVCREEIANFDDILSCFNNKKLFLYDETSSVDVDSECESLSAADKNDEFTGTRSESSFNGKYSSNRFSDSFNEVSSTVSKGDSAFIDDGTSSIGRSEGSMDDLQDTSVSSQFKETKSLVKEIGQPLKNERVSVVVNKFESKESDTVLQFLITKSSSTNDNDTSLTIEKTTIAEKISSSPTLPPEFNEFSDNGLKPILRKRTSLERNHLRVNGKKNSFEKSNADDDSKNHTNGHFGYEKGFNSCPFSFEQFPHLKKADEIEYEEEEVSIALSSENDITTLLESGAINIDEYCECERVMSSSTSCIPKSDAKSCQIIKLPLTKKFSDGTTHVDVIPSSRSVNLEYNFQTLSLKRKFSKYRNSPEETSTESLPKGLCRKVPPDDDEEDTQEWDEVYMSDTSEDEEIQGILDFITTSMDDKSSLSGISTGCSEWEWRPTKISQKKNFIQYLKSFCQDCRYQQSGNKKSSKKLAYGDSLLLPINFTGKAMYPMFDKGTKYPTPLSERKDSIVTSSIDFLSLSSRDGNKSKARSKLNDAEMEKDDDDVVFRGRSKSSEDAKNRNKIKFRDKFSPKSTTNFFSILRSPIGKEEKAQKRQSHFFTEDFATNLPFTKSWLDSNLFPNYDCKGKFNRLFRSKSLSFPKEDEFSDSEIAIHEFKETVMTNTKKRKEKGKKLQTKLISKSLPKCKGKPKTRTSVVNFFKPKLKEEEDGKANKGTDEGEKKSMTALNLAAESRDYLMWCPDSEFDKSVADLDMRGLVDLVHTLQDAMAVEQQTFESLSKQLEGATDPLLQQRMSAALCTSQTRLARLCSRNMRCFSQQALKSRPRSGEPSANIDSRSSSPRDSGFAVSSSGSDFEGDLRGTSMSSSSPPGISHGGASFKHSMAFFQKAANFVVATPKSSNKGGHVHREAKRSYRRTSAKHNQKNEQPVIINQIRNLSSSPSGIERSRIEDTETYENVLFINGRPQYQDDSSRRSHSYDGYLESRKSDDEYRPSINESDYRNSRESRLSCPGATSTTIHITSGHSSRSHSSPNSKEYESSGSRTRVQILNDSAVDLKPPSRPVRLKDSIHSKSLSDVTSCVSPPRRKPVLNFSSIADGASDKGNYGRGADCNNKSEQNRYCSSNSQIKRSHSFKEGLDFSYDGYCDKGSSNLCRTQSCCDGLAGDIHEKKSSKLSRAPSVDEILESVKSLRAKRSAMVKSSPDLLLQQSQPEKNYSSSSRQKSSCKKSSKISTSSLVGVHFNGSVGTTTSSKSDKYDPDLHYYENIKGSDHSNQYENLPAKKVEVIYDRPTSNQKVEKRHKTVKEVDVPVDHYENINFEPPLYENMSEDEPTYMNVSGKVAKRKSKSADQSSNLYANIEETSTTKSKSSKKNRQNDKNYVDSLHVDDNGTYDVPKAATHIYDTPPKQTRQVCLQTNYDDEGTYDTPKNNRSVLPQSTQMLLKVKKDQMKKIEDLFADCEKDSLSGGIKENSPDIPPPDYSVEGETIREVSRGKSSSPPSDYIDEGLGESDGRSYYADDQGLEVILEEPEDDCSSTHSSEEDLRRRLDLQLRLKGERRSLDGSEGIGSAEGDSHSSGSDIGAEDDCASSGIHSEDTSLGHPHIERSKEEFERTSRTRKESSIDSKKEEDQIPQQDRCVEVYPETLRQRQRNMAPSPTKVDIKNWENNSGGSDDDSKGGKKFLPSVKALRSQFENGKPSNRDVSHSPPPSISPPIRESLNNLGRTSSNSSTSSLVMSSLEASSGFSSLASSQATSELLSKSPDDEPVEPIFNQFHTVGDDMMCQPPSTIGWNPQPLLKKLYYIPEAPKMHSQGTNYINIDGYLEKLPSGRKKATFWNAWKRRYFVAKDGTLYYYQNNQTEKPNMKLPLMGGKVEIMDQHMVNIDDGDKNSRSASMLGIDDGKGHYVVVRCPTRQEAERWKKALDTHTVEDFSSQYVQPWPRPTNPTLLRDTLIIDIGSCSVRAGVLASQPTLPQLFFPSVVATNRETRNQIWGIDALMPHLRTNSSVAFPIRPSHKISKFSVDLNSISSLLQKTFRDLKVDPKNYNIQLSVPRVLNQMTQVELLKILFDKFGVKAVNLTHQSILALYAYNATSGIVVDIGERIDVVPVTDGYIVDGGVSRIPYGGFRILDHIRQFLFQRNLSLVNEVDSYVIRQALESVCYSAQHYNTEKQRCTLNTENFEKMVPLEEFFPNTPQYEAFRNISLDFGRFQVTEGLFNPDAWGLDHPGLQKLVHKAIQECSMDIRKEMSRSIFLSGGLSQLPGISERLTVELDNLTPPAIHPKVHSSPYRYHAAYIGACVLAESPAFFQSKITKEEWQKQGNSALRKWAL